MATTFVRKVYKHFENVTDPRADRGETFPLLEMVFVALCAAICDCNGWADVERFGNAKLVWLRKFMPFEKGIPSHDTFTKVFARLDTLEFYAALESWAREIAGSLRGQTVAFDGKTLRGSHDKARGKSALHSVSAWACGLRLCLALKSVGDKSNEIPAVQELIDMLDLQGSVVTADAMHCQCDTAQKIIDKKADYVLMVKGNQKTLQQEVESDLTHALTAELAGANPRVRRVITTEMNRGRRETREVAAMPVPKRSKVFARWAGLRTIGYVHRTREIDGRVEESHEYFISSLRSQVRPLARHLRSHWGIENSQHHVLDVVFTEDASRIRRGNGPEISSAIRRLALGILQQDTRLKGSLRGKRKVCGWSETAFEQLLAGFAAV